jgi:hypothetical protein
MLLTRRPFARSCAGMLSGPTRCNPDGLGFGLCDLGMGEHELGYVSLLELAAVRGKLGLLVERDLHFKADKSISAMPKRLANFGASSRRAIPAPRGEAPFFIEPKTAIRSRLLSLPSVTFVPHDVPATMQRTVRASIGPRCQARYRWWAV